MTIKKKRRPESWLTTLVENITTHRAISWTCCPRWTARRSRVVYQYAKVPEERKQLLEQLIKDNLSKEDTDNIMRTIADSYIEEGFNKGLVRGIEKGREEGREEGIRAGMEKAASNMLKSNLDLKFISSVTGLPIEILQKLKASL